VLRIWAISIAEILLYSSLKAADESSITNTQRYDISELLTEV